jgi:hypothetical protein
MLSVSLCCSFLIVSSVYSSVYFLLCLVYPMLPVPLCCSLLIDPSVYSGVYFVLFLVYPKLSVSLCFSFTEGTIKNEQSRDTGNIGYTCVNCEGAVMVAIVW